VSDAIASGRNIGDGSMGGYVLCEYRYAVEGLRLEHSVEPDMWEDGRRDPEKLGAPTAKCCPEKSIWPLDLSGGGPGPGKRSELCSSSSSSGSNTVYGFEDRGP
jgi:hypothetical protein